MQCPDCKKEEACAGKTRCVACAAKVAARTKERAHALREAGLCMTCGATRDAEHSLCDSCRARLRAYAKKRRLGLTAQGLCVHCSINPVRPGHVICRKCSTAKELAEDKKARKDRARAAIEKIRQEENQELISKLHLLPERHAQIIKWRRGIGCKRQLTLEEIGVRLGLTRERVRQLEEIGLNAIRNNMPYIPCSAHTGRRGLFGEDVAVRPPSEELGFLSDSLTAVKKKLDSM